MTNNTNPATWLHLVERLDAQTLKTACLRFCNVIASDPIEAADLLIKHFAPSGDDAADTARRAEGYTVTTDLDTIIRTINHTRS